MQVRVRDQTGVPEGSIFSVRVGTTRKQGQLQIDKPIKFTSLKSEANPFTIDLYAPIASTRLTLLPQATNYTVDLDKINGGSLRLGLEITDPDEPVSPTRAAEKEKAKAETQDERANGCKDYIGKHGLMDFMQHLMQSLLVDQPADPFDYLEKQIKMARSGLDAAGKNPAAVSSPKATKKAAEEPKPLYVAAEKSFEGPAFTVEDAEGQLAGEPKPLDPAQLMAEGCEVRRFRLENLGDTFEREKVRTPMREMTAVFQNESSLVTQTLFAGQKNATYFQMLRAGPRERLHFRPQAVTATIVTCGGLCPGLNSVVRELVHMLNLYGVTKIYGVCGGYKGIVEPTKWIELTEDVVQDINDLGGTMLSSDRGNPPVEEQAEVLQRMGVTQHYVIGGDGTHRGAYGTYLAMRNSGWECAVVGIPKTIDNDVPMLDKTFGFDTACTEAVKAINAAYTEATCNANCIGLVKLMGRHCGFIAQNACLAARYVDICLLPEMNISEEKVLSHVINLMQTKGHCVIVVAEGCGNTLIQGTGEKDAGGNVKLADVGPWLRDRILARFKEVRLPLTIKYIDPTYMIRAVKPNANDSVYCAVLADNAVHAAMAGYTGITIGRVCNRYVILPMQAITQQPTKRVDLHGRWFFRLISSTRQPDFRPEGAEEPAEDAERSLPQGLRDCSEPLDFGELLTKGEIRQLSLEHLSTSFGAKAVPTTIVKNVQGADIGFLGSSDYVTQTLSRSETHCLQLLRAGPRSTLHFQPEEVAAAIVTCGGLCPGLNSVIRELVMMLYAYGVRKVYGIRGGYKGVTNSRMWVTLTPDSVKDIHVKGGTVLVADRGNPTPEEMAAALKRKGIRQYFVLGGDGTHRGAYKTFEAMKALSWECAVVGVPKTIDNDINLLDQTFGFETASSEAQRAIDTAYVEATCNANCIGLVKLMGRHCGYLAMMSVLAARHADICLLPEMDVELDKVLDHAAYLLKTKGFAVIVVAEGCGDTLVKGSGETDAGGNKKLADAGLFMKDALVGHFKDIGLPLTVKYVDPTYMVRAIPANSYDSIYCAILAQGAVHAAMAGYTGVTVAKVDECFVWLPIRTITNMPNRKVEMKGRWIERLLATTKQPNLSSTGIMLSAQPSINSRRSIKLPPDAEVLRTPNVKLTTVDGYGRIVGERPLQREDVLRDGSTIRMLKCFHLSDRFGTFKIQSALKGKLTSTFCDSFSWTTQSMTTAYRMELASNEPYYHMVRAGPREFLHFDPNDPAACAAIVSCGGICPGLNSVIREIVNMLWSYGVRKIWGIKGGFKGVPARSTWVRLDPEVVRDIHVKGGTILVSDRGNPSPAEMAAALRDAGVRQYFVLGGDGTHKGAMESFQACMDIDHECAVIGVPKTIDNDVPLLDQTFGFDTACTEAVRAINSAYVEATCNANCIGLVKLMGRHCGFISLYAALAARTADIVLLPEMEIDIEKVLDHTVHLMKTKRHAVVVVAEGCGDTLIKSDGARDAGGNKVLADVGPWLKNAITARFKKEKLTLTIKYIDPTYMIRSIPANAFDSAYCSALAQHAVHGAMAGYSGITVGKVYDRYVYLPIDAITRQKGRRVNPGGRWFQRLIETTLQPDFTPAGSESVHKFEDDLKTPHALAFLSIPGSINEVLVPGTEVRRLECVNLKAKFTPAGAANMLPGIRSNKELCLGDESWTTQTFSRHNKRDDRGHVYYQMLRGGPRATLHFEPTKSNAVIVTCGGLCPGLNSVIREIVMTLSSYGVSKIYGCVGGFKGMVNPDGWRELTPESVRTIHLRGGTVLVSDRGNPPHSEIANALRQKNITQFFVIGGDGTHRGAMATFEATQAIGYECAVVGVPKTIDNDIPILDKSFGYKTACTEAVKAIKSAYAEATGNSSCIGLVKLMGRHCGWIALEATLAARNVDICLIPEMNISLPKLLTQALHLVKTKGFATIVVAEGCGDTLIASAGERDAGGNKKLADVGAWLNDQLSDYFRKMQVPLTIKYIDPTYTIRAVEANANDSVYCSILAQQAVHGAMAGYSGITVGKVDERYVMLPIHAITTGGRKVDLHSRIFERLLSSTAQPDLAPSLGDDWALLPPFPPARPEPQPTGPQPEVDLLEYRGLALSSRARMDSGTTLDANTSLQIFDGFGVQQDERSLVPKDIVVPGACMRRLEVMYLQDKFSARSVKSPLNPTTGFLNTTCWTTEALGCSIRLDSVSHEQTHFQFLRAGPREHLHFDPKESGSCAAILTSGGLSPGSNAAIRQIVLSLHAYGVERVYGISDGFKGVIDDSQWTLLTADFVKDIHEKDGTILSNTRGNPPAAVLAQALKKRNVRQFFALGGEGTHKGVLQVFTALLDIGHECACLAVPSSINNDIAFSDRSLGFDTACTVARDSVDCAYVEATCNANCIGLVKLTGSSSGFLAMEATLASRVVDICLLPEMEIDIEKVLTHAESLMSTKGYAVVVVTEGCRDQFLRKAGVEQDDLDVGLWLRDTIMARFKERGRTLTIKYIDPTYTVRSCKANAFDSVLASGLAENAVHGAMAGITGVSTAVVYNRDVYLPLQAVSHFGSKRLNPRGRWFARMLFTTRQPSFEPDGWTYPSAGEKDELLRISTSLPLSRAIPEGTRIRRLACANLGDKFASRAVKTPLKGTPLDLARMYFDATAWTSQAVGCFSASEPQRPNVLQLLRSGPREVLHFDPSESGACATIVTCGGLCPGLNSVIRELANMLRAYGVKKIWGIRGGYNGCTKMDEWIELTEEVVQNIHMQGGSILVSDRGNPPPSEVAKIMKQKNVRQFFVLGGDGTHRGALEIFQEMTALGHECAVVGVPKTIDNDVPVLDRSFGFDTACTEAERAISSAYVEATTNANCIGLVKLMGRHCGWIAAMASLANRHVDVCLLPEMNVSLPKLLHHVADVMRRKRHAVIVVAEGCGDTIIQGDGARDAGGNKLLADVGPFIKDQITSHCKSNGIPVTIKYIDPTYMIRSVAANAYDSKYCASLAQEAVHCAMAGCTGITVGKVDERYVMLPIFAIGEHGPRKVDLDSKIFTQLVTSTGQPTFEP